MRYTIGGQFKGFGQLRMWLLFLRQMYGDNAKLETVIKNEKQFLK